ncbi:acyltransferase family protein [Enterobacter asburiae]|uniref:acyltransferase family protein n=1 Tax=Enterobacter asburiae TaxID=61645 RepID=UPI001B945762|nr:acyltransferase [Enterobacter asburiae]MBR8503369.1 acyltransferase [Enterobacter asburiae]
MKSKNINYMPRVDHLRLYAALLVILVHSYMAAGGGSSENFFMFPIMYGSTGVTLFLVLSGFLFTLISDFGNKEIKYSKFITNRILRVFPLLILVSFTSVAVMRGSVTVNDFLSTFLFSNLTSTPLSKFFGPTWTIAVELQFYLIFPFIIAFVRNSGVKYLFGLIAFWLVWRALIVFQVNPDGVAVDNSFYYLTIIGRLDQFLVGMLAAFAYRIIGDALKNPLYLVGSSIFILCTLYYMPVLGIWYTPLPLRSILQTWEAIAWAALIVSYLKCSFSFLPRTSYILSKLGELSYSAYITHGLVLYVIERNNWWISLSSNPNLNAILNGLLVVFPPVMIVSWLSFSFVEKPFLTLRRSYTTNANQ